MEACLHLWSFSSISRCACVEASHLPSKLSAHEQLLDGDEVGGCACVFECQVLCQQAPSRRSRRKAAEVSSAPADQEMAQEEAARGQEEAGAGAGAPMDTDAGGAAPMEGVQHSAAAGEAAGGVPPQGAAGEAQPDAQEALKPKRERRVKVTQAAVAAEAPVLAPRKRRLDKAVAATGGAEAEGAGSEEVQEEAPGKRRRGRPPISASAPAGQAAAGPTGGAPASLGAGASAADGDLMAEGTSSKARTRGGGPKRAATSAPVEAPAPKRSTRKRG